MPTPADVRAAWSVSVVSVAWTVATGTAAVVIGVLNGSAVLVAFGAIGFVDGVGSAALAYHFRHGLRHDALSDHLEHLAHRVVVGGLLSVGIGAVAVSTIRLATGHAGHAPAVGVALAGVSLAALVALATLKVRIAARVSSGALRSDGHLSAVGAAQAAVTLLGTAATRAFDWQWMDAAAAVVVGAGAVVVAVRSAPTPPDEL